MERRSMVNGALALKGINIQTIRANQNKRRIYRENDFTPLQIQLKSLNKISSNSQKQSRATRSSRKVSKISVLNHQMPDINREKPCRLEQTVIFKLSSETNSQKFKQKPLTIRKKTDGFSELGLKKINLFKVKKCTCGDCQDCLKDFTYFLHIFSNDNSVPEITAKSWCIWKKNKNNKFMYYYGKRIHKVRQIASLTKIVTAMTTIDYLNKYDYNFQKITYQIRKPSIMIGGTTACLQQGEIYTISQLLYALMLPSGNDAAIALSEVIGLIFNLKLRNKHFDPYKQNWYCEYLNNPNKSYSYHFIALMNQKCQKMGLIDTHIYNSHGNDAYDQLKNVSTCNQIAKISGQYMLKYDYLKDIVHTKFYKVERYQKTWQNTNRLLDDGFEGIKTGITDTAGPCLSACYKDLIIIVLNSKSMNERWIQVKKLVRWIVRKGY